MATTSSYVCDTLPAARLATDHPIVVEQEPIIPSSPPPERTNPRTLCVRHQRMADEGTNLKLQQVCRFCILIYI